MPWDITPALRPERLLLLDRTIRGVRNEVVDITNETDRGDNIWVVGCRAHAWLQKRIKDMCEGGEYPWLSIESRGLYFCVRLEREPIRIYKGDPEEKPGERHVRAALRELEERTKQVSIFAEEEEDVENEGWFWMLAVDTDAEGRVLRTGVLQAHETRDPRNLYIIDGDELGGLASLTTPRKPVDLPPVNVDVRVDQGAQANDTDGDEGAEE